MNAHRPVALVLVFVLAGLGAAWPAHGQGRSGGHAGRPLSEALLELARRGAPLVFSSRLVRADMLVVREPRAGSLRATADQLLEPHGLRIDADPNGRWLVVAQPTEPTRPAAPVATRPDPRAGAVRVTFRRDGSGEPVAATSVAYVSEAGTAEVRPDGSVEISGLAAGPHFLEATVPGHQRPPPTTAVVASGRVAEVRFDLTPTTSSAAPVPDALPGVEIVATRGVDLRESIDVVPRGGPGTPGGPAVSMVTTDLMQGAGDGGNLLAPLQTLPGVKNAREFDGRLVVRGGSPDQNLVLIDGVEVLSPYHVFGLTSAFLPTTVESVDLSPGGFDARHGDRLSSVLSVRSSTGGQPGRLRGAGGAGLFEADLLVAGSLPRSPSTSWVAAGRYSYVDLVANSVLEGLVPRFGDLHTRLTWEPRPGSRLSWLGLVGRERSNYRENDDHGEDWTLRTRVRTALGAVTLEGSAGSRALWRLGVSVYDVRDRMDMLGLMLTDARGTVDWESDGRLANIAFGRHAAARDWTVRHEWTVETSPQHMWEVGAEAHWLRTRWWLRVDGDRNPGLANRSVPWPYGMPGASLPSSLDSRLGYGRSAAWLQHRRTVGGRLSVQAGMRFDRSDLTRQAIVTPRTALTMRLGRGSRLMASAGGYSQSPGYEKLLVSDYFLDLGAGQKLKSERAFHTAVGFEHDVRPGVRARVEVHRKGYADLIVGRLERDDERLARLARYDFGSLSDHVPATPQITGVPVNGASGVAYGLDAQLIRTTTSEASRTSGWVSYSYGVARRRAYSFTVPFDYDRRHVVAAVAQWRLHPSVIVSGTVRVASGAPWTDPQGVQIAAREDRADVDGDGNRSELIPARDALGRLIYTHDLGDYSRTNSARLPFYARLDARVTYRPGGPLGRWTLYVDIINLLNRENPGLVACRVGGASNGSAPTFVREPELSVPVLPSIGARFSF